MGGLSFRRVMAVSRLSRTRAVSFGSKTGFWTTSANRRQRAVQVPGEGLQADVRGVPAAARRQRRAQGGELVGDLQGASGLRPLVEHAGAQLGETGAVGRIGRAAGLDHEIEVHQRKVVELHEGDLEPVLQLEPLPRWRMESGLGAGRGRKLTKRSIGGDALGTGVAAGAGQGRSRAGSSRRGAGDVAAERLRRRGASGETGERSGEGEASHFFTTRPMMGA